MPMQSSAVTGNRVLGGNIRLESFKLGSVNGAARTQYELIFSEELGGQPKAAFFTATAEEQKQHDQFSVRVIEKHASHLLVELSRVDHAKGDKNKVDVDLDVLLIT